MKWRSRTVLLIAILWGSTQALTAQVRLSESAKVKTRKAPLFSALAPGGKQIYITCFASDDVVLYQHGARKAEVHFYGGFEPQGIAITPVGDKLFVTNRAGLIKVIDTKTHKIVDDIKVGGRPSNITIAPTGFRAFVTNYGRGKIGRVDFIDTSTHRIIGEVEIGVRPIAAAVSPLGDQLFVACAGSNEIYVVSTNRREVLRQIPVGVGPNAVVFSPDGTSAYVTNSGTNDVSVIDTLELEETRRVPVGSRPFSMAVDKQGRVFVVETGDAQLSLYSPSFERLATIKAGKKPIDVKLSPDGGYAYVTDEKGNKLLVFKVG